MDKERIADFSLIVKNNVGCFLTTSVIVVICVVWCMDIYDKKLKYVLCFAHFVHKCYVVWL